MSILLLINDDGPQSPTVQPFAIALHKAPFCDELRIVLPAEEQSWIAQAITRFRSLTVFEQPIGPVSGFLVNGTPADCANLGINNLYTNRPDFVVSGINIGSNAGLAFFLSSGTIGGAAESFLFGIKAIAVSIDAPSAVFKHWSLRDEGSLRMVHSRFTRLAEVAANVVEKLFKADIWNTTQLVSVNIPWEADLNTRCEVTRLAETRFQPFFSQTAVNKFRHVFDSLVFPPRDDTVTKLISDVEALDAGLISVNPIRYRLIDNSAVNALRATLDIP